MEKKKAKKTSVETENKQKVVKKFRGIIVSKNTIDTVKVKVEIRKSHPLYGKILKSHKSYLVDARQFKTEVNIGDEVIIAESKPLSKLKKFVLINKVK